MCQLVPRTLCPGHTRKRAKYGRVDLCRVYAGSPWSGRGRTLLPVPPALRWKKVRSIMLSLFWGGRGEWLKKGGHLVQFMTQDALHCTLAAEIVMYRHVQGSPRVKILIYHWVYWHNWVSSECRRLNKTLKNSSYDMGVFCWKFTFKKLITFNKSRHRTKSWAAETTLHFISHTDTNVYFTTCLHA